MRRLRSRVSTPGLLGNETELEATRTQPVYRGKLARCLRIFYAFASACNVDLAAFSRNLLLAEETAALFVQWCYDRRVPFWMCKHGLLAIQTRWRHLKGTLGRGWDALRSWGLRRPLNSRTPITLELLQALAAISFSQGLEHAGFSHLFCCFSVLVRVGFFCLLRPGELTRLRAGDVLLPAEHEESTSAVLRIVNPKNAQFMGRCQFAMLHDGSTIAWLRWLVHGLPSGCKLWPSSANRFRSVFTYMMKTMELSHLKLGPGSLRPGGTTHQFRAGISVARLKFWGRWASESSLNVYVQECMARLVECSLSSESQVSVIDVCRRSQLFWTGPPAVPWQALFLRARQWQSFAATRCSQP